jgi:hypothetical protein
MLFACAEIDGLDGYTSYVMPIIHPPLQFLIRALKHTVGTFMISL